MRNSFQSSFVAVFQAEILLNSKRVAPYALILLFTGHALLWWGWGAAASFGWAVNSDFNIVRNLQGFSFLLGLPIFNAVLMGDPVIRDFRTGIDPLIFSKPISRASYLFGKFFGNLIVLVCCQSAFVLTMILLQWVHLPRLVMQDVKILPYFKHFFFFVVISHLVLAVVYFTIGTLTRSARIVYILAVAFYPLYIAYQLVFLRSLPQRWRILLDPMLLGSGDVPRARWVEAAWINQIAVVYSSDMILNRVLMIVAVALCLLLLYLRFSIAERSRASGSFTLLSPSSTSKSIHYDSETFESSSRRFVNQLDDEVIRRRQVVMLPEVVKVNHGITATFKKIFAATGIELNLLRYEKSLIVLIPLAVLLSFLSLPFSVGVTSGSVSTAFAVNTAQGSLFFLLGVIVFYAGEAMARDREVRVEPILWSAPAANPVFLLSKFFSTFLLVLFLLLLIALTAMLTQLLRGHTPIEVWPYLILHTVILIPSLALMTAACLALSVILREKYLAYAVTVALGSALFYLYNQGYNHWLYNPFLYGLWTEVDLAGTTAAFQRILGLRLYCIGLTLFCLLIAHLFFPRRPRSL